MESILWCDSGGTDNHGGNHGELLGGVCFVLFCFRFLSQRENDHKFD